MTTEAIQKEINATELNKRLKDKDVRKKERRLLKRRLAQLHKETMQEQQSVQPINIEAP